MTKWMTNAVAMRYAGRWDKVEAWFAEREDQYPEANKIFRGEKIGRAHV